MREGRKFFTDFMAWKDDIIRRKRAASSNEGIRMAGVAAAAAASELKIYWTRLRGLGCFLFFHFLLENKESPTPPRSFPENKNF